MRWPGSDPLGGFADVGPDAQLAHVIEERASSGWSDRAYRPGPTVASDAMAAFMDGLRSMSPAACTVPVLFDDATDAKLRVGFGHPYA